MNFLKTSGTHKILLCGFSGAGKSTLLKHIESKIPQKLQSLKFYFNDLDDLILKKGSFLSIKEFIESVGWEHFRDIERKELLSFINRAGYGVLSLGGGALSQDVFDEISRMSKKILCCYVKSSFETCYRRLLADRQNQARPLLSLPESELRKIYHEREEIFQKIPWIIQNEEKENLSQLASQFWSNVEIKI